MATKLRQSLKQLISVRADPLAGPSKASLYKLFATYDSHQSSQNYTTNQPPWITLASATLFTLNSPHSLTHLWSYLESATSDRQARVDKAAFLREVGLKSISFIGIAKIINELGVLTSAYSQEVKDNLPSSPRRSLSANNLQEIRKEGHGLWTSVYDPFSEKLLDKLGTYHPDLPVHILESHYGPLLSNPPNNDVVDRISTSLVAIACLRAQEGVGPQVTSHIFGLRKAANTGWLATDDGSEWCLNVVDHLSEMVKTSNRQQQGRDSKL